MINQLFSFLIIVLLSSQSMTCLGQNERFAISGYIDDINDQNIILTYPQISNKEHFVIHDTTKIIHNKFQFYGSISEPALVQLSCMRNNIQFFIEPVKMKLYIKDLKTSNFKLIGSKIQEENERFEEMCSTNDSIINLLKEQNNEMTNENKNNIYYENSIHSLIDSLQKCNYILKKDYIKKNPESFYSVFLLRFSPISEYSIDSITNLYQLVSEKYQNSTLCKTIKNNIDIFKNVQKGNMAPNFNAIDWKENYIELDSFRNNIVLLDFWASWCIPCSKLVPHLQTLYKKYNNQDFRIIGISLDRKREDWIKAIETENIGIWSQILSDSAKINLFYPPTSIPYLILIDREGKIIDKWSGYSQQVIDELNKVMIKLYGY